MSSRAATSRLATAALFAATRSASPAGMPASVAAAAGSLPVDSDETARPIVASQKSPRVMGCPPFGRSRQYTNSARAFNMERQHPVRGTGGRPGARAPRRVHGVGERGAPRVSSRRRLALRRLPHRARRCARACLARRRASARARLRDRVPHALGRRGQTGWICAPLVPLTGVADVSRPRLRPADRASSVGLVNAAVALIERVLPSTVHIQSRIPESHPSARILGTERMGSGTVVDSSGLVLTVNYVVLGAEQVRVTLLDQRAYVAALVRH